MSEDEVTATWRPRWDRDGVDDVGSVFAGLTLVSTLGERRVLEGQRLVSSHAPRGWPVLVVNTRHGVRSTPVVFDLETGEAIPIRQPADASVTCVGAEASGMTVRCQTITHLPRTSTVPRDAVLAGCIDVAVGERDPVQREVIAWETDGGTLEGVLSLPDGRPPGAEAAGPAGRARLVVDVHGGPWPGVGLDEARAMSRPWIDAGFAHFAVEYRASGALGNASMQHVLGGQDVPGPPADGLDVIAGFRALKASPFASRLRLDDVTLCGFSYGGYLVNRMATEMRLPFARVVCHEGVADLRALDDWSLRAQSVRRGRTPEQDPEHWSLASPIDRADQVGLPMLLAFGRRSAVLDQGRRWRDALRAAGHTPVWFTADQSHVFDDAGMTDLVAAVAQM